MKKIISVLLTIILIFGCLPITSFAVPKSKKYEKNRFDYIDDGDRFFFICPKWKIK